MANLFFKQPLIRNYNPCKGLLSVRIIHNRTPAFPESCFRWNEPWGSDIVLVSLFGFSIHKAETF